MKHVLKPLGLAVLCGLGSEASATLPDFIFATALSENIIDAATPKISTAIPVTSGGTVSPSLVASFGEPFAGLSLGQSAEADLTAQGTASKDAGSVFLTKDDIFKKGLISPLGLGTLVGTTGALAGVATYSDAALADAELAYRRALRINPYDTQAALGILRVRQAQVLKNDLVSDFYRKREFINRYTDSAADATGRVLSSEIAYQQNIASLHQASLPLLLELLGDPLPRGPGALLRGEIQLSDADAKVVSYTFELIYSAGYRLALTQYDLGRKQLLLNFFNNGTTADPQSRNYAADQLLIAHDYLNSVLQMVSPFAQPALISTNELYNLTGMLGRLTQLASLTRQGYNPFGFLPEFVPFAQASSQDSNLSTYNTMRSLAADAAAIALQKEQEVANVQDQLVAFAQTEDQYHQEAVKTAASYDERLKTLAGVVLLPNGVEMADIWTVGSPDTDVDGDGKTERDALRDSLIKSNPGTIFGAKGQVAEQYLVLAAAEAKVEQTFNQMKNNVDTIADKEQEAREISGVLQSQADAIIYILQTDGSKVSALIREKGKLQQDYEEKLRKQQQKSGLFGSIASIAGGIAQGIAGFYLGNPQGTLQGGIQALQGVSGVANGIAQIAAGVGPASIQSQLADIDAKINDIKTSEQVDITLANMSADKEKLLINTKFLVRDLVRQQANLRLDYYIAQRDYLRELAAISNRLAEVHTLLADSERIKALAERIQGSLSVGWYLQDVRDVLTNRVLVADQAFDRAQVWAYITLQALSYYGNQPPETDGRMNAKLSPLYRGLYYARRASDLSALINRADSLAKTDFLFSAGTTSCQSRGLLSLKYDILVSTATNFDASGKPVPGGVTSEGVFRFQDPSSGVIYEGAQAYQARFRQALKDGYNRAGGVGNRSLKLVFATDLLPRKAEAGVVGTNPFYLKSAVSSKITGFQNPNCLGIGVAENAQGIQLNLTGGLGINAPFMRLSQRGNSYLKHSAWTASDFNAQNKLINPLVKVNIYSSYQQLLPTWLIDDINPGAVTEATIGSDVSAVAQTLRNGQGPGGKILAFTDRSVANDHWELLIEENESSNNSAFFEKLEQMLGSEIPADPSNDFLTDIQLWTGWAYRN